MKTYTIILSEEQIEKVIEALKLLPDDKSLKSEDSMNTWNPWELVEMFEMTLEEMPYKRETIHAFVM